MRVFCSNRDDDAALISARASLSLPLRCDERRSCCQDPREELLKYEEATKDDKEFLGSAYEKSQPEGGGMFHRTLEQEEEDFKEEQRKLLDS